MTIKEIITKLWAAAKARFSTATNLLNGSSTGALRTSGAAAEGSGYAMGQFCHAEGRGTRAKGTASHAEGCFTIANGNAQHVDGSYNLEDSTGRYIRITGGGSGESSRANIYTLDKNGIAWFKGGLKAGGTSQDDAAIDLLTWQTTVDEQLTRLSQQISALEAKA